jgi:hypothetical protein
MRRRRQILVLVVALTACTSKPQGLSPEQRTVAADYVAKTAPSPRYPLVAVFDERVRLLGYDLDPTEWRPGKPIVVTWYWEVLAPPRPGSRLVTRLESVSGEHSAMLGGGSPVRALYGPEYWRAGDFVRDEEELSLPRDWSEPAAMVLIGLRVDDQDLDPGPGIALATPNDSPPAPDAPAVSVIRTKRSPKLDGALSDDVWTFAEPTTPFSVESPWEKGGANVDARLMWDSRFLYVGVQVQGKDSRRMSLMIDPTRRQTRLLELEVSSKGELHVPADGARAPRVRSAVASRAQAGNETEALDRSFELAIPWQAFSRDGAVVAPPEPGDRWRFDAAVTFGTGDEGRSLAWVPRGGRGSHATRRFGTLRFEGTPAEMTGSTEPIELPEGRMPAPMRRSVDPTLHDSLLRQNAAKKRRIDALRAKSDGSQRLESSGDGH